MSTICRTCLKVNKNENYTYLNINSKFPESDCLTIKAKLLACVPEVSINIVPDPSICNTCVSALQIMYQFWSLCLQTEETIRNYMQKNALGNNSLDLNSLVEFKQSKEILENDNTECELIEVECRSPIELNVEPDLIDIKYLIPSSIQNNEHVEQAIKEEVVEDNSLGYFENYSEQREEIIEVEIKNEGTEEIENESQNNLHVCHKCGEWFTSQSSLRTHTNLHLEAKNKWSRGNNIKRSTLPLKRLNELLSRENTKKSHICDICGKCFPKPNTLKAHMNAHNGERPFKCEICCKHFNFKNNLQRHMLLHEDSAKKRFKCNICDKFFTRKEHLTKHMISHTDEVPYQCTLCKKQFKYMDSLRGHLKYHSGEKRFHCEICGNGFIRRDNLHVHLRTMHVDVTTFECNICKATFNEKSSYEEHKIIHTGRVYYKCKTCDKLFKAKQSLRIHANIHLREKPYKCTICNSAFSQKGTLTHHMRRHTGEKPFTCYLCEKKFTQKSTLRNHLQKHRCNKSGALIKEEEVDIEENALGSC